MLSNARIWIGAVTALQVLAQNPTALTGIGMPAGTATVGQTTDAVPRSDYTSLSPRQNQEENQDLQQKQNEKTDKEIRLAKAKDKGPLRFAADLFETRQYGGNPTEGGISEDYVLGVGDRLQMSVFGSAAFEVPLQVDGRGAVAIPKVGTVPVAGMSLGRARSAIQNKIAQLFSRSTVDLSVTKLREVRVFVLGEVYRPGSYLVPSLSSIINILSLSGGPTRVGSYREIRVIRGGRLIHSVDLYPLRAEGLGNLNFGFQNGDTLFVPLVHNQVQLEGGFTRVVATVTGQRDEQATVKETDEERRTKRLIQQVKTQLAGTPEKPQKDRVAELLAGEKPSPGNELEAEAIPGNKAGDGKERRTAEALLADATGAPKAPTEHPEERTELEERLDLLQQHLDELKSQRRGDQRIEERADNRPNELAGQPAWLSQWILDGKAPVMQFEMLQGETVQDALRYAGGFALKAFSGSVSLRRMSATGALDVVDVPAGSAMAKVALERGDVLTALPLRDFDEGAVSVKGWARVQGVFARREGQRVGDLLKNFSLVLPDTYLERGELVRTLPDGSKRFLSFNITKAMAGEDGHNLPLEGRDSIELYRIGDPRVPLSLTVVGPLTRPGKCEFIPGMRASDLLFRAGVPLNKADQYVAELAHTVDGKTTQVSQLDLTRLLSNVDASPVDLKDERINPLLRPYDQLSIYAKPDYREHRTITLTGQVVRPGSYDLENDHTSLRDVIKRAGGLTSEAMPRGGIFLRAMAGLDQEKKRVSALTGIEATDPTSNGINEILGRLNETKRMPVTGTIEISPLLHNLKSGSLNRLVVDIPRILAGDPASDVTLLDGDEIIIPRRTEVAYVVGEAASPFAAFKVGGGTTVRDLLGLAGGPTPNADTGHIRLLKADGRIVDSWVSRKVVEPGDAVLVPQKIRRDVSWQENLAALTPLAILVNALRQ